VITRQTVIAKLLSYLNGEINLASLVKWGEQSCVNGRFHPYEDADILVEIVTYIAEADRPYNPLTWEVIIEMFARLGAPVRVVPLDTL
jgi:hypothetical protein